MNINHQSAVSFYDKIYTGPEIIKGTFTGGSYSVEYNPSILIQEINNKNINHQSLQKPLEKQHAQP